LLPRHMLADICSRYNGGGIWGGLDQEDFSHKSQPFPELPNRASRLCDFIGGRLRQLVLYTFKDESVQQRSFTLLFASQHLHTDQADSALPHSL